MSEIRQLNEEDERDVLNKLMSSKLYQRVYQEVLSKVQAQNCYKCLKNMGINKILEIIETSDLDVSEKEQKVRLCYSKIKVLTDAVDENVQNIIKNQFQNSSFLNEVREEVLKYLNEKLNLVPPQHSLNKNYASVVKTEVKSEAEDDEDDETSSFENFCESDVSTRSFLDDSSDSVSSVHTSDLSSFDDEISISSDEETGRKRRRISLKLAQEVIRKKKLLEESETNASRKKMNTHDDDTDSENSSSDSQGGAQNSSPPWVRKANTKYASEDIISPLSGKQKEIEKMLMNENSTKISSVPRKVGRPRKKKLPNL